MFSPHIGLLRVIDAIQQEHPSNSSLTDPQRVIEFPELNFAKVSTEQLLDSALSTLHPEIQQEQELEQKQQNNNMNNNNNKPIWIIPPSLCAASDYDYNDSGDNTMTGAAYGSGGSILPDRASLLACGLSPVSGKCEVYLIGKYNNNYSTTSQVRHHHNRDNNRTWSFTSNDSTTSHYNNSNYDDNDDDEERRGGDDKKKNQSLFSPTKVMVTFWCVKDRPSFEIDLRRALSEVTLSKFKKVLGKFSGISATEMLVEVDGQVVTAPTVELESKKKVFPFFFDPTLVPSVRIRSKSDNQVVVASSGASAGTATAVFSPSSSMIRSAHAPRIEAEYGTSNFSPLQGKNNNNNNNDKNDNNNLSSQIVPIEKSRDWSSWLAARKQAREVHVRQLLAPSSKEQLEIERALQVRSLDDVRVVTKTASNELASTSQLLHQQLESVRAEILRERLGDATFARSEGERGLLLLSTSTGNGGGRGSTTASTTAPITTVKTAVSTDGLSREPVVINFR